MSAEWVFRKTLAPREAKETMTSALELPTDDVNYYFSSVLLPAEKDRLLNGGPVYVAVHDGDSGGPPIRMRLQRGERSHVTLLGEGDWGDKFVAAKNLKKGDTVELKVFKSMGMGMLQLTVL